MSARSAESVRNRIDRGLIPAVPVPFDSGGQIGTLAQERYARYMAAESVAGVAIWAHTGRGLHLNRDQRQQVLSVWRGALGQGKVVVAGVGASPRGIAGPSAFMDSALAMAQDALEGGADALLVHPPTLFRGQPREPELIIDYHRRLASTGAPLILFYLYEAAGGISYSAEILRSLLSLPEVVGIKLATLDSVMTYQSVASMLVAEFPQKLLITGEDRFLGYSLMCGARAALIGMGAACTKLQHDLMQSYFAGGSNDFLRLSNSVDYLSQVLFVPPMEGYIRRMLWALVHLGVLEAESAHDPWGPPLEQSEFEFIGKTLRALGELKD
jgi:4-hydroxy-tetrahydrodipicolinate synthase